MLTEFVDLALVQFYTGEKKLKCILTFINLWLLSWGGPVRLNDRALRPKQSLSHMQSYDNCWALKPKSCYIIFWWPVLHFSPGVDTGECWLVAYIFLPVCTHVNVGWRPILYFSTCVYTGECGLMADIIFFYLCLCRWVWAGGLKELGLWRKSSSLPHKVEDTDAYFGWNTTLETTPSDARTEAGAFQALQTKCTHFLFRNVLMCVGFRWWPFILRSMHLMSKSSEFHNSSGRFLPEIWGKRSPSLEWSIFSSWDSDISPESVIMIMNKNSNERTTAKHKLHQEGTVQSITVNVVLGNKQICTNGSPY